jgi:hypothetical protein
MAHSEVSDAAIGAPEARSYPVKKLNGATTKSMFPNGFGFSGWRGVFAKLEYLI